METTERIVEAYIRYVKGWFTMPNIKCDGQNEIDILAIDPTKKPMKRYHIEVSVSISSSYSKLTNKEYDPELAKVRVQMAKQRTTLGHFIHKKFASPGVVSKLEEFGFSERNYEKIVVVWDWIQGVEDAAKAEGIELWRFKDIIKELSKELGDRTEYYSDDILRTLQLHERA